VAVILSMPWTTTTYFFLRGLVAGVLLAAVCLLAALYFLITLVSDPHGEGGGGTRGQQHPATAAGTGAGYRLVRADLDERKSSKGAPPPPLQERPEDWPAELVRLLRRGLEPGREDSPLSGGFPVPNGSPGPAGAVGGHHGSSHNSPAATPFEPVAMGETESCVWLNLIAHRYFLSLRSSPFFAATMMAKTSAKMNQRIQSSGTNYLLKAVDIIHIDLGTTSPKILGIRLLKGVTQDLAVMVDLDVTYAGGACIVLQLTLHSGVKVPVHVYLNALAGCVGVGVGVGVGGDGGCTPIGIRVA
jgi:hypothetical protein